MLVAVCHTMGLGEMYCVTEMLKCPNVNEGISRTGSHHAQTHVEDKLSEDSMFNDVLLL